MSILHDLDTARTLLEVRARARQVAEKAPNVVVVRERLAAVAAEYREVHSWLGPPLDAPHLYLNHGIDTFAYVIVLATIRFGTGYHKKLAKRGDLSVAQTIAAGLTDRFRSHGPLTPRDLVGTTSADCAAVFGQDLADPSQSEVMELFARALRDLGRMMTEQFPGSFPALAQTVDGSAARLVQILVQMPFFADVQNYRGLEVPFLLRAQRAAVDLSQAFGGGSPASATTPDGATGAPGTSSTAGTNPTDESRARDVLPGGAHLLGSFTDLDLLTPSADNVIPHVLRIDGVLRYDRGLAERIDRGEAVPAHTEREVEIRAAAVHAVELIVAELAARGTRATHAQVDTWLRQRGRHPSYREKPRHRARTVFY